MQLQFRNIVRASNRLNRQFAAGSYGADPDRQTACAIGMVAISMIGREKLWDVLAYPGDTIQNIAKATNLDFNKVNHLEGGFENRTFDRQGNLYNKNHPQYKVGLRLRALRINTW